MRVLIRLHGEPGGVPVEELVSDRGEDVLGVLGRAGPRDLLVRCEASVRLSDLGTERINGALQRLAEQMAALVEGVPAERLALLRDVSLLLILNHHGRQG